MTDSRETEAAPSDDLAARLWAIEKVLESVVIDYWLRYDGPMDMLENARSHVEHGSGAGADWAYDQGAEPGDNPAMEALVAEHTTRILERAYRRLDGGLRRIGGADVGKPPEVD